MSIVCNRQVTKGYDDIPFPRFIPRGWYLRYMLKKARRVSFNLDRMTETNYFRKDLIITFESRFGVDKLVVEYGAITNPFTSRVERTRIVREFVPAYYVF